NLLQQADFGPTLNRTQQFTLDQITNPAYISNLAGDDQSVLNGLGIDEDLAVVHSTGLVEYGLKDGVNSPIAIVDQIGNLKNETEYEPFGETTKASDYPFEFTGRTMAGGDLYYYRARFYDSDSGRFLSEDPVRGGRSSYAYANGNPILFRDPIGANPVLIVELAVIAEAIEEGPALLQIF